MFERLKFLVGRVYIVVLMAFTVWYGFFLYPVIFGHDEREAETEAVFGTTLKKPEAMTQEETAFRKFMKEQKAVATTDLGYTVVKEQYVKGHFHHIGMTVESDETNVCVRCHGAIPHDKSKAIRGFLNMHAFYLACETCHIHDRPELGTLAFRWYDKKDGRIVANPPGLVATEKEKYGNYGTKVAPGVPAGDGAFRLINGEKERAFVVNYLRSKDEISSTEQSKMKKVIHRMVNDKPLLCESCHVDGDSYLPMAELGYPPRRIAEIKSTAVIGLIKKYRDFYIPKFLLPGQGWDERRRAPKSP